MAKYINREAALSIHEPPKLNRHYQTDNLDDVYSQGWNDALCSIEHISAADVAPVVHGWWGMGRYNLETGAMKSSASVAGISRESTTSLTAPTVARR